MTKLILIVVAFVAVVWLLRRALSGPHARSGGPDAAGTPPPGAGEQKGELVACAQCGVNLPQTEARSLDEKFYCSEEHMRLGPKGG